MALPNPAPGDSVAANDIDEIRNHLEGGAAKTAPYKLRQSTGDFIIVLADAAGASEVSIHDSADVEVAHIDSNGDATFNSITFTNLDIPTSAAPSQTTEGRAVWDTDDDALTVGSGTATLRFRPEYKGSDVASAAALNVGVSGSYFDVTGTTTITSISTRPAGDVVTLQFDGIVTVTHNATSLILLGGVSAHSAAGSTMTFVSEGSGNWRQTNSTPDIRTVFADVGSNNAYQALAYYGGFAGTLSANTSNVGLGLRYQLTTSGTLTSPSTTAAANLGMTSLSTGTTSGAASFLEQVYGAAIDPTTVHYDASVTIMLRNDIDRTILFGYKPNSNVTDENNFIGFRILNNGNIIGVCDNAGTETTRDSGFAGSASPGTRYRLRFTNTLGTVRFYVNGVQVLTDVTTNVPTGSITTLLFGITNSAAADKRLDFSDLRSVMKVV